MGTTRFSGPVMYSGAGTDSSGLGTWFRNLPIQANPDYIVKMDDFIGVDIDDIADIPRLVEESRTIAQGIADSATRGMAEAEHWDMLESMSQHMQDPSTVGDDQIQDFYNRIGDRIDPGSEGYYEDFDEPF